MSTLLVVNELAAEPQVDAILRLAQIHQLHWIFAEVVGENAVFRRSPVQLQHGAGVALHHAKVMHLDGRASRVAYGHADISPGLVLINMKLADEVGHAGQTGMGHHQ